MVVLQALDNSYFMALIRIPKENLELEGLNRQGLLDEAKIHILKKAAKRLGDGRRYHVQINQEISDLELPDQITFEEYKTTIILYLLDAEECAIGDLFFRKSDANIPSPSSPGNHFKLVKNTEHSSIWMREY
jgi:hypothetical protein